MADVQLDCQGLNCPMPIVRVGQTMKTMHAGQTLEVTANDPAFSADVRAWVTKTGHELLRPSRLAVCNGQSFTRYERTPPFWVRRNTWVSFDFSVS